MGIFYNCIHWRVCALPCPLEIEQCKHYSTEEDFVKRYLREAGEKYFKDFKEGFNSNSKNESEDLK